MSRLKMFLLGPPRFELDGAPVHIGRTKAVALLAYLGVTNLHHGRDVLAALLWPDFDQRGARAELRRALSALNRALGKGWIEADRETAGLCRGTACWLDVVEFRKRLAKCDAHKHPTGAVCAECVPLLEEAVTLYSGDFMAGFALPDSLPFDEWQLFQTQALNGELVSALERLVRGYEEQETYEAAFPHARRWAALDATNELVHRRLMLLYARSDQVSAALHQYQVCADVLSRELGTSPADETAALYQRIRSGAEPKREAEMPSAPPHNLPPQATPFVGRNGELVHITKRLDDASCRLLTLVGPGGIGKTRLAIEAARSIAEVPPERVTFRHGVFFVPLAGVGSADALVPTIASGLDFCFYEGPDPKQQLLDYLRGKSLLLMLDNFEHLLDGVDLITELLSAAPRVKVVVTSREALNLHGEWFHPIDGLSYPLVNAQDRREGALALEEYEAVALFTQCARRARPGVCLEQELDDVARICQLVEGMPLAIELAASWLKVLPARKIAEELERGLDILSTTMRDLPRRHRSMRAAFDRSWCLLNQEERDVLRRLSVFRGGCRLRAAQAVAGAALPALAALVDKSLLTATREGRYQVHELLRQYAAEKLLEGPAEWETAHSQHSAYFAAFVEERGEALKGAGQQDALAELRAEIENVRAAWDWAVERGQFPLLDQALEGLCRFYEWRGRFQEGQMSCRAAAEKLTSFATSADELGILARTWIWCSFFDLELGKSESAGNLIRQSLDLLDRPEFADRDTRRERAVALCEMGRVAHNLGERGEARKHCEQSLALFRSVDLCWEAARVLERLGDITYSMSLYREAERCYEESLAIRQSLGDRRGMADSLFGLSITAAHTGQSEQAEHFVGRAIAIQRELGNEVDLTHGLFHLGNRYTALGRFTEACPLLEEAAEMYAEMGMRTYLAIAWDMLAWAKTNLGLYEDGSALLRKSHTEFRELGDLHGTGYSHLSHGDIAVARGAYAEAERHYRKCLAIFQKVKQRDEEGLAHAGLALAARGQNDIIRAHKRTFEALKIAVETGAYGASLFAVSNAALLYADAGEIERAVELCALVKSHAYFGASRLRQDMTGKHIDAAAAELTPEVIATAQERGHARDLWDTAAELLEELALKLGL